MGFDRADESRKPTCKLVAYYRVSTQKQGTSGLGLEAQQDAVARYAQATGCKVVREHTEIETGKKDDLTNRPELQAAVSFAKRSSATLVIAKMDRLTRSLVVLSYLKVSGVRFVACDNPDANELLVDILVSVAAAEVRMTSTRTREALRAYRENGRVSLRVRSLYPGGVPDEVMRERAGKLGGSLPECRNLTDEGRAKGILASAEVRKAKAGEAYRDLVPIMVSLRDEGLTLQAIADRLNADGETTRTGKAWNAVQVMRVLKRSEGTGG